MRWWTLLAAALGLISPDETATLLAVHTGRHAALYGLRRLQEADEAFGTITALCATATERAGATAVQVRSLTHQSRFAEAIALSVESTRRRHRPPRTQGSGGDPRRG